MKFIFKGLEYESKDIKELRTRDNCLTDTLVVEMVFRNGDVYPFYYSMLDMAEYQEDYRQLMALFTSEEL